MNLHFFLLSQLSFELCPQAYGNLFIVTTNITNITLNHFLLWRKICAQSMKLDKEFK